MSRSQQLLLLLGCSVLLFLEAPRAWNVAAADLERAARHDVLVRARRLPAPAEPPLASALAPGAARLAADGPWPAAGHAAGSTEPALERAAERAEHGPRIARAEGR